MYMIDEVEEIPYSEEEISRIPSITGYIVKSGDTLWNIAKHYGTTIEKMKQYNENLTEPLETGQKLFLLKEMESLIGEWHPPPAVKMGDFLLEEDKYIKVMNKNAGVRVISDSVFFVLKIYRKSTHLH